ncbi:hypothetical protein R84981_000128 [Carnimonas sp. R-84981]
MLNSSVLVMPNNQLNGEWLHHGVLARSRAFQLCFTGLDSFAHPQGAHDVCNSYYSFE